MTPTSLWPIIEFIGAFALGVGMGSWDLIRVKAGVPTQPPSRRSAVVVQSMGIVMLILVGSSTYEQYQASAEYRRVAECQARYNDEFRDGLAGRADANQASNDAEIAFVDSQLRFARAMRDRAMPTPERDAAFDAFSGALQVKRAALLELRQARVDNPVDGSRGECNALKPK